MARYALFQGYDYEASGGWRDLDHIGTLDECKAKGFNDWAHIVDLDAGKMVLALKRTWHEAILTGHPNTWTAEWVAVESDT
jgi:hypothetical protein